MFTMAANPLLAQGLFSPEVNLLISAFLLGIGAIAIYLVGGFLVSLFRLLTREEKAQNDKTVVIIGLIVIAIVVVQLAGESTFQAIGG